ncbi:MAG: ABC transporter ATP-binding protein [Ruminococcaceae bacterium]|nr:ABC transporter ATP-binding protein [Oscillospiraceae bacterium]
MEVLMKGKTFNKKKGKNSAFKDIIYGLKILNECGDKLVFTRIISVLSFWFFTGFVEDILLLKYLLQSLEKGVSFKDFVIVCLIFLGLSITGRVLNNYFDYLTGVKKKVFYKKLNEKIFEKAINVDMDCFYNPEFFDKYKRATEIVTDGHFDDFCYGFACVVGGSITGAFLIAYVITVDPKMLFILLIGLVVVAFQGVKSKLEVNKDKEMTIHKRSKAYVKRTIYLKDFSKDMRTSGIYGVLHTRFENAVNKNREIIKKYGYKVALLEMMTGLFGMALPVATSYAYATYRYVVKRNLALSDFSVIVTAMGNLKDVINDLTEAVSTVKKESLYFRNLKEFFDYENKIENGTKIADEFKTLEFKNVKFTYPEAKEPTLKNFDFKLSKGQTVAVVGENGAGKSTFIKLLLRFYDVDSGEILYNGVSIKEYDIDSLRNRISTVFQDYKVFALSVAENVLCKEITTNEELIKAVEAMKNSGAYDFVENLPEKENTVITREFDEKGVGLSGGEQQKLAVARVFASNTDLAILDEPSSAFDPVAEYKMYENLIKATKDKTVIYISHRLSSAVLSDNIFVISDGTVKESGNHKELMELNGIYSNMFTLQAENYKNSERSVS